MICSCCGGGITTSGGCISCMGRLWCVYCQAQFCANHGQEAFARHYEKCSGVSTVSVKVTVVEREVIHDLKCWPVYYRKIVSGEKPFDVRKGNDRTYQVGDYLDLREWDPETKEYTKAHAVRKVTYVMHGAPFLPDDLWVLGLSRESYP